MESVLGSREAINISVCSLKQMWQLVNLFKDNQQSVVIKASLLETAKL